MSLSPAAKELFEEAQQMLARIIDERLLTAHGVYGFWPANSDGDDIRVQGSGFRVQNLQSEI